MTLQKLGERSVWRNESWDDCRLQNTRAGTVYSYADATWRDVAWRGSSFQTSGHQQRRLHSLQWERKAGSLWCREGPQRPAAGPAAVGSWDWDDAADDDGNLKYRCGTDGRMERQLLLARQLLEPLDTRHGARNELQTGCVSAATGQQPDGQTYAG